MSHIIDSFIEQANRNKNLQYQAAQNALNSLMIHQIKDENHLYLIQMIVLLEDLIQRAPHQVSKQKQKTQLNTKLLSYAIVISQIQLLLFQLVMRLKDDDAPKGFESLISLIVDKCFLVYDKDYEMVRETVSLMDGDQVMILQFMSVVSNSNITQDTMELYKKISKTNQTKSLHLVYLFKATLKFIEHLKSLNQLNSITQCLKILIQLLENNYKDKSDEQYTQMKFHINCLLAQNYYEGGQREDFELLYKVVGQEPSLDKMRFILNIQVEHQTNEETLNAVAMAYQTFIASSLLLNNEDIVQVIGQLVHQGNYSIGLIVCQQSLKSKLLKMKIQDKRYDVQLTRMLVECFQILDLASEQVVLVTEQVWQIYNGIQQERYMIALMYLVSASFKFLELIFQNQPLLKERIPQMEQFINGSCRNFIKSLTLGLFVFQQSKISQLLAEVRSKLMLITIEPLKQYFTQEFRMSLEGLFNFFLVTGDGNDTEFFQRVAQGSFCFSLVLAIQRFGKELQFSGPPQCKQLKSYFVSVSSPEVLENTQIGIVPFLTLMDIVLQNLQGHFDQNIFTIMYTALLQKTEGMKNIYSRLDKDIHLCSLLLEVVKLVWSQTSINKYEICDDLFAIINQLFESLLKSNIPIELLVAEVEKVARTIYKSLLTQQSSSCMNILWSLILAMNTLFSTQFLQQNQQRCILDSISRLVRFNSSNYRPDQALELSLLLCNMIEAHINQENTKQLYALSDMVYSLLEVLKTSLGGQDVFLYLCTTVFKARCIINMRCEDIIGLTQSNLEYQLFLYYELKKYDRKKLEQVIMKNIMAGLVNDNTLNKCQIYSEIIDQCDQEDQLLNYLDEMKKQGILSSDREEDQLFLQRILLKLQGMEFIKNKKRILDQYIKILTRS